MSTPPAPANAELANEPENNLRRSRRLHERSLVLAQRIAAAIDEPVILSDSESSEDDRGSIMAEEDQPLNETGRPGREGLLPSIARPTIAAPSFEIKSSIINMLQNSVQFDGKDHEDPGRHIASFLEVCSTFKIRDVSEDAIRLRLFPFSLRDKARSWLLSLPAGSITTWNEMADLFMQKYSPPEKTAKLKNRIMTFKQDEGESLHAAWERFKDLLIDVPHHGLSKRQLVLNFYQGLNYDSQERLDVYAGGDLGTKTPNEAYAIIEKATLKSSSRYGGVRNKASSIPGVHQVDTYTALAAQIGALAARFDQAQNVSQVQSSCELCGVSHEPGTCEQGVTFTGHEEVDYLGNQIRPQNNPYSNMYNPGWRNHPNFRWKANSNNQNPLGYAQRAPAPQQSQGQSFQPHGQSFQPSGETFQPRYNNLGSGRTSQPQTNSKLEEMMAQLLNNSNNANQMSEKRYKLHEERFMAQEGKMRSQKASIQTIENQVGQLAKMLSERPQGSLPGNTEPNPRGHVNAVMARSGKATGPDKSDSPPITDTVQTDASDEVHARRVPASTA
ncbi:uncharacterized protein LOC110919293 [Helianthus annuus]|uniref:uncharacterized protein LOC110919293 n=1 Tax=Helianthus annuus TaxID=4232 RepID=UPI000B8FFDC5|nr:uncharacterized protein LOC110919293 [Helianthus annuus]